MSEETIKKIAFNVVFLGMDIPKEDKIATLGEIALLAQFDEQTFSYWIEFSLASLEAGYDAWKNAFASFAIAQQKSELILNINKLF